MLKKGYMIIALALVSVLLGSLVYNNITQAQTGKYRIYKDSVEIRALEWSSIDSVGVWLITVDFPLDVFFTFSPKSQFLNITKLGITITAAAPSNVHAVRFNVTINDKAFAMTNPHLYYAKANGLTVTSTLIENPDMLQAISIGINNLKLRPSANLWLYRVTVFIEYEYQTR